jgi:hypothetical protein
MKWMISEDRLGADQREVIDELGRISTRPIWIQGYAGSGKSVLLLHSLKDYMAKKPNANVCVVVFTKALVDLLSTGLKQIPFLEGKSIPVQTIYQLNYKLENGARYDAIFCDEVQDLPSEIIEKMNNSCTHLIIAGDAAQSIYTRVPIFDTPPASTEEIIFLINPIEKALLVIYRLTSSVISMLRNVFPDMLSGRPVVGKVDTEIKLFKANSSQEELDYCWRNANEIRALRPEDMIAILLNKHESILLFINKILEIEGKSKWAEVYVNGKPDYKSLYNHLQNNRIPLMYIGNGFGSLTEADRLNKIVIMTFHSSKGLDFDRVYLPWVGDEMRFHSDVPVNALLLVALSRSKSGLTVSFTRELNPSIKRFLLQIQVKPLPSEEEDEDEALF